MILAFPRPTWLTSFWGALLTLGVMLSSRTAHAQNQASLRGQLVQAVSEPSLSTIPVSPTLAALSASVAATLERAASSETDTSDTSDIKGDEPSPSFEVPVPPWMAGLCDARGATSIAPLPAMPVGDGVVAADESGCEDTALRAGRTVERNEQPAPPPLLDAIDPSLARAWWLVLSPVREVQPLPYPQAARFALPPGFGRGIDEPPRG